MHNHLSTYSAPTAVTPSLIDRLAASIAATAAREVLA